MTKKFLKEITKRLQEEEASLAKEIGTGSAELHSADELKPVAVFPSYGEKEDENAAEVAAFETNLAIENTLEQSLRDVRLALKKIDDGTYGTCETCGKPIAQARLEAFPTARQCLQCKAEQKK